MVEVLMGKLVSSLMAFLIKICKYVAILIINYLVDIINGLIELISTIFSGLLYVFPSSDLTFDAPASLVAISGHINWFIPINSMVIALGLVCASYVAFFSIRPILKFIQVA